MDLQRHGRLAGQVTQGLAPVTIDSTPLYPAFLPAGVARQQQGAQRRPIRQLLGGDAHLEQAALEDGPVGQSLLPVATVFPLPAAELLIDRLPLRVVRGQAVAA